jgi:hypothetical protein
MVDDSSLASTSVPFMSFSYAKIESEGEFSLSLAYTAPVQLIREINL